MAKIRSNPDVDSYTAVHWLRPALEVRVCNGTLADGKGGRVPCGNRSDAETDAYMPATAERPAYCVNGCEAGDHALGPQKIIVEVGADCSLLNVILPTGVSFTVWGNGDAAIFTDPDDELGECPDVRVTFEGRLSMSEGEPWESEQHQ